MDKIAILTGATGGLGQAFIKELLKEDINQIWAIARNKNKLDELCNKYGDKIFPIQCDLCEKSEIKAIADLLEENKPDVKFLINNAGMAKMAKTVDFTEDEISKTIEINCKTPTLICQYAIPYMSKGSRILNISSASSFQPNPYIALYSATKVYLRSYSRSLNYELKDKGIACTAVCPGWIDTEMLKKEHNGKAVKFPGMVSSEKVVKKALKDAKKGKDMSVCSLFVKYEHICSKILPQKWIMNIWGNGIKKYI
ncbi:MAG: SDR family NAD(P)-dependent oxidoreductase [Clostridiales bacterium]|nr:SDR family NAD(P)-dependent oxidoreductase [Clostridiales bacterium]